jgi:hypothetical protein
MSMVIDAGETHGTTSGRSLAVWGHELTAQFCCSANGNIPATQIKAIIPHTAIATSNILIIFIILSFQNS